MPAKRKDTTARGAFARCIIKHIDEWFSFARERGLGIRREDIVLVTGCHLTRTWATVALQEGEQVAFGVRVSDVSNVMWQFTREGAQGVEYNLGPSGQVRLYTFLAADVVEPFESTRTYRRISAFSLEAFALPGFQ